MERQSDSAEEKKKDVSSVVSVPEPKGRKRKESWMVPSTVVQATTMAIASSSSSSSRAAISCNIGLSIRSIRSKRRKMKKQTLTAHPTVRTLFHEMDKQIYIYMYNVYIPYIANHLIVPGRTSSKSSKSNAAWFVGVFLTNFHLLPFLVRVYLHPRPKPRRTFPRYDFDLEQIPACFPSPPQECVWHAFPTSWQLLRSPSCRRRWAGLQRKECAKIKEENSYKRERDRDRERGEREREREREIYIHIEMRRKRSSEIAQGVRPGYAEEGTRGRRRGVDEGDRNSYANLEEMPL
ncbi:hypothetical protein ALC57_17539 [Trachymyrmex cornetzi]|uniref:Uncharacterized protein n=1 Tax=Trachymyrmex cornetzi TaxID=471704 RepID=A0A195DBZ1_9HYME|nr:hypothetical protein ALC57_17539 [Trachymyrmex cornetzi]